jgi:hypothetical protein
VYPPPRYKPVIDAKGVGKGKAVPFSYRTGSSAQLKIEATWSEKKDTTLVINVNATY